MRAGPGPGLILGLAGRAGPGLEKFLTGRAGPGPENFLAGQAGPPKWRPVHISRPDWALTQDGPIQFTLPVNREYFTDLSNCYLKVQLQVFKSDGSVLDEPDEQKVSLFHALFVKND